MAARARAFAIETAGEFAWRPRVGAIRAVENLRASLSQKSATSQNRLAKSGISAAPEYSSKAGAMAAEASGRIDTGFAAPSDIQIFRVRRTHPTSGGWKTGGLVARRYQRNT